MVVVAGIDVVDINENRLRRGLPVAGQRSAGPQERQQVGHFLEVQGLLDAFGHERSAGGADLGDLGAEDGLVDSLGLAELQAGAGLLGQEAGEDLRRGGWRR